YATTTGRVLIRWDGGTRPIVWTVPAPDMDERDARLELARRYLHGFGPGTVSGFGDWAGRRPQAARQVFDELAPELVTVHSPIGEGQILASDEASFRSQPPPASGVRLLPSGDTWFLLQGI